MRNNPRLVNYRAYYKCCYYRVATGNLVSLCSLLVTLSSDHCKICKPPDLSPGNNVFPLNIDNREDCV